MKPKIKIGTDILMTVALLLLMAYQVVGRKLHEWFGAGMLVLFIAHSILNIKWYGALFKGKYKPLRIFGTVSNFAVLAAVLMLGYSGIVMSRHLFAFLKIGKGMALARSMHLCVSYWSFVLMSLHLGFHWGTMIGLFRKLSKGKKLTALVWIMRVIVVAAAVYGAVCFIKADIFSYMFLKNEFAFFDFEKSAFVVFAEYVAMMTLWIFIGHYAARGLGKIGTTKQKELRDEENQLPLQ